MRQRSTDSIDLTKFTAQTNAPPVRQSRVEMHSFVPSSDPSQRLPATTRRLRQNPTRPLKLAQLLHSRRRRCVPIAPVTAFVCRIAASLPQRAPAIARKSARHSCTAVAIAAAHHTPPPRARTATHRARQSPVRLQSCTNTVHETATLPRRRDDALSRNAQDAQGPEQAPAKTSPKTSFGKARSGL